MRTNFWTESHWTASSAKKHQTSQAASQPVSFMCAVTCFERKHFGCRSVNRGPSVHKRHQSLTTLSHYIHTSSYPKTMHCKRMECIQNMELEMHVSAAPPGHRVLLGWDHQHVWSCLIISLRHVLNLNRIAPNGLPGNTRQARQPASQQASCQPANQPASQPFCFCACSMYAPP